MATGDIDVRNNREEGRFEVIIDGDMAELDYVQRADDIIFVHTEVPVTLRGKGIAGVLARTGLAYARDKGLAVVPMCPFVRSYIERHAEYKDLVSPQR